jgi:hypothetical protein
MHKHYESGEHVNAPEPVQRAKNLVEEFFGLTLADNGRGDHSPGAGRVVDRHPAGAGPRIPATSSRCWRKVASGGRSAGRTSLNRLFPASGDSGSHRGDTVCAVDGSYR